MARSSKDLSSNAIALSRAALAAGPMTWTRGAWWHGPRSFHATTIAALIRSGEAIRIGNGVIHADHLKQAIAAE